MSYFPHKFCKMPRVSERKKFLQQRHRALVHRLRYYRFLYVHENDEDAMEIYMLLRARFLTLKRQRFFFRKSYYRKRDKKRERTVHKSLYSDKFSNREFREHFRVDRDIFEKLHDKIKCDRVFNKPNNHKGGRKVASSRLQLLVLLKYLGSNGNGTSLNIIASFFKMSRGAVKNYIRNVVSVLLKFKDSVVFLA